MSAFFGLVRERQWAVRWVGRAPTTQTASLPEPQIIGPTYFSEPMWRMSLEDILAVMSRPSEEWTTITLKSSTSTCGICFDDLPRSDALQIPGCGHSFCVECLRTYTEFTILQSRYPIKCPTCSTVGEAIHGNVEQEIIDKLHLNANNLKSLLELQIAVYAVSMRCPKCTKTTHVDRRDYILNTVLTCPLPLCQHSWCRDCELEVDPANNSHQCRNKKLERLMRRKGWRYCPGCRTPIQKVSGCNHITCQSPGCSVHFCYQCGDLIIDAAGGGNVSTAIGNHYRRCRQYSRGRRVLIFARGLFYAALSFV